MRTLLVFVAVTLAGPALGSEPEVRIQKQFKGNNYRITWGTPRKFDPKAELEIGDGGGHGGTLRWLRFRPERDGVGVLSVVFDAGRHPYESKWPPDRAPVTVKSARMKPDTYASLLDDLAIVDAAKLESARRESFFSTGDFWVYTRLTADKKTLIDLNWAGYESSDNEVNFAKPQAAVLLTREAVKGLDFKDHVLTDEERGWASAKFARDWKKFENLEFHWWVRERYIETIGVVGDKGALPTLRDILEGGSKEKKRDERPALVGDASQRRCVYYAINAVTRLTKKDVRDKPVEEMDLEKTRRKVLDLLRDEK